MSDLVFDHIGIVVPDLDADASAWAKTVGAVEQTVRFDDPILTVSVRFIRDKTGIVYELIAPLGEKSIVSGTLEKKQSLLNQLAYTVTDLPKSVVALRKQGYFPLGGPKPALAFGNAPVQFLLSPLGFVIELIEKSQHQHDFQPMETEQPTS